MFVTQLCRNLSVKPQSNTSKAPHIDARYSSIAVFHTYIGIKMYYGDDTDSAIQATEELDYVQFGLNKSHRQVF